MRRILWAVLAVLGLAILVPIAFIVRHVAFPPTFAVPSIAVAAAHQQPELLARAWALPVARTYEPLVFQSNGSVCGPASLANVMRSLGVASALEASVLEGSGMCWAGGVCLGGLTLDELAALAAHQGRGAKVLRGLDLATFREHIKRSNDPSARYIVNFHRGMLFGKGGGHHSPIGGYLEAEDLVLVLDVNANYMPWLVATQRLFEAVDTEDSMSGAKRGLLRIE